MTDAQLRNLGIFILVCAVNALVIATAAALAAGTMPGFREGEFLAPAKGEIVALLALAAPILSGWIQQNRPRFGSEQLAAETNAYREMGYSRADLTVVPRRTQSDMVRELEGMTPSERDALVAELELRNRLPGLRE